MDSTLTLTNLNFSDINPIYFSLDEYDAFSPGPQSTHNYYLLYFVLENEAIFIKNHNSYHLKKGQGIIYSPGEACSYNAATNSPFQYVCIGFFGARAHQFVGMLDLGKDNPVFDYPHYDYEDIRNYYSAIDNTPYGREFFALSFLYRFFAYMSNCSMINRSLYVSQAIGYITQHMHEKIKVSDIANALGITRIYLYKIFEDVLKQSPKEYILTKKLQEAYELLRTSKKSVAEIAQAVGYDDQFAFSKLFKSKYHISPRNIMSGKTPHIMIIDDDNGKTLWPAESTKERVFNSKSALVSSPYYNEETRCIEGWILRAGYLGSTPLPNALDISFLTNDGKSGALCFDIFVEDQCDITDWCINAKDWIRFGSSLDWDTDFQYWLGWHKQITKEGWNNIRLPFGDSQWGHICGNPDYKKFVSFAIMLSVSPNKRIFIDNIRVVS